MKNKNKTNKQIEKTAISEAEIKSRVELAKSLFGILPNDVSLDEAVGERASEL